MAIKAETIGKASLNAIAPIMERKIASKDGVCGTIFAGVIDGVINLAIIVEITTLPALSGNGYLITPAILVAKTVYDLAINGIFNTIEKINPSTNANSVAENSEQKSNLS